MAHHDVIVLGTGGVGSAALYHVASRGFDVLGLDRFPPGHDRGSSHGQTRIIRQAYFEHPSYVPLLRRAYRLWSELEELSGQTLLRQTGLLQVGPADGVVVPGVLRSAAEHALQVEHLRPAELQARYPQFGMPANYEGVYEACGGCLHVEACVKAYCSEAEKRGAQLRTGETIFSWRVEDGRALVETDRRIYSAKKLIIAAGPWAADLLADLGLKLRVLRKHMYWFENSAAAFAAENGCPAYLFELPHGVFYGFPQLDGHRVKVAEHSGGAEVPDPLSDPRLRDAADETRVTAFVRAHLPGVTGGVGERAVCFYTMSADEHFILDRHPEHENVFFACGLSGHGFKFTGVLGEALAALAVDGETELPIGFLGLSRPGLS